jgi:mannose-6-phosphate isomerase-like protein (cupin superfamily)
VTSPVAERVSFDGQTFVLHRAGGATWGRWRHGGFACPDSGIGDATGGLAEVMVVRATSVAESSFTTHDGALQFWFVLAGELALQRPDQPVERLGPGDAVAVPAGMPHALAVPDAGCEFLEVNVPVR